MHTGMLWFDNSNSSLPEKVKKALDYYEKKYGKVPNLCLVHPASMEGNWPKNIIEYHNENVVIRAYRPVLPGHIWIGIDDESH